MSHNIRDILSRMRPSRRSERGHTATDMSAEPLIDTKQHKKAAKEEKKDIKRRNDAQRWSHESAVRLDAARKEQADRARRAFRESGDYLGVQGANPRTGYWDSSNSFEEKPQEQKQKPQEKKQRRWTADSTGWSFLERSSSLSEKSTPFLGVTSTTMCITGWLDGVQEVEEVEEIEEIEDNKSVKEFKEVKEEWKPVKEWTGEIDMSARLDRIEEEMLALRQRKLNMLHRIQLLSRKLREGDEDIESRS